MIQTAKVTAKGEYNGRAIILEVIEYDGGLDEEGDRIDGKCILLKNGKKLDYSADDLESSNYLFELESTIHKRSLKQRGAHVYNPPVGSLESYWLAFNHGDGFDKIPSITVEGTIDTFGSPFSDEDTSLILFL